MCSSDTRRELHQPRLAAFAPGSATLTQASRDYIASLADSLRPAPGQLLVLEGHAPAGDGASTLAYARAQAVARYLVDTHRFNPDRVSARAWLVELDTERRVTDAVNARLIFPTAKKD